MTLLARNYQSGPVFHGVIQKIKVARFIETRCINLLLLLLLFEYFTNTLVVYCRPNVYLYRWQIKGTLQLLQLQWLLQQMHTAFIGDPAFIRSFTIWYETFLSKFELRSRRFNSTVFLLVSINSSVCSVDINNAMKECSLEVNAVSVLLHRVELIIIILIFLN